MLVINRSCAAIILLVLATLFPRHVSYADQATLVRDLNTSQVYLTILETWHLNGKTLARADDGELGEELWYLDQDPTKSKLISDIYPGGNGSQPRSGSMFNGRLYFSATTSQFGTELWSTDGTPEGTVLVKDVSPGPHSSEPSGFVASGTKLFFTAITPATGREVYVTDGSREGTRLLADIRSGAGSSIGAGASALAALSTGHLLFRSYTPESGYDLWRSDGTVAGTMRLYDFADNAGIEFVHSLGNKVILGRNLLWVSDGTVTGTHPIAGSHSCSAPQVVNGKLVCIESSEERALIVTDGSAAGTYSIPVAGEAGYITSQLLVSGSRTLAAFVVVDGDSGETQLWRTDGSAAGTSRIQPTGVDAETLASYQLEDSASSLSQLFIKTRYLQRTQAGPYEETSQGVLGVTAASTTSTEVFRSGLGHDFDLKLLEFDSTRILIQSMSALSPKPVVLLSGSGEVRNYDITEPNATAGASPTLIGKAGETLILRAIGAAGVRLWASDGSFEGTIPLLDYPLGSVVYQAEATLGAISLFRVQSGSQTQLVRSDGSLTGTYPLLSFESLEFSFSGLTINRNGLGALSLTTRGRHPSKIVLTDGTLEGTIAAFEGDLASNVVSLDDSFYFFTGPSRGNQELRRVDPAQQGSEVVTSGFEGIPFTGVRGIGATQDRVIFIATVSDQRRVFSVSEGAVQVAAETTNATAIHAATPTRIIYSQGTGSDFSIWATGGSPVTTERIYLSTNYLTRVLSAGPVIGDRLVFITKDGDQTRTRLYATDGTLAGTREIATAMNPGQINVLASPWAFQEAFVARVRDELGESRTILIRPSDYQVTTITNGAGGPPLSVNPLLASRINDQLITSGSTTTFEGLFKVNLSSGVALPYVEVTHLNMLAESSDKPLFSCQIQRKGVELCGVTARSCTADTDRDGTVDCDDRCPVSDFKTAPGMCGCDQRDLVDPRTGSVVCQDECPLDPQKMATGECGCGIADIDADQNGTIDCKEADFFRTFSPARPTVKRRTKAARIFLQNIPGSTYLVEIRRTTKGKSGKRRTRLQIKQLAYHQFSIRWSRIQSRTTVSYKVMNQSGHHSLSSLARAIRPRRADLR